MVAFSCNVPIRSIIRHLAIAEFTLSGMEKKGYDIFDFAREAEIPPSMVTFLISGMSPIRLSDIAVTESVLDITIINLK